MVQKSKKLLVDFDQAYNFALDRLSIRDYGAKEMEGKLRERSCPSAIIAQVMAKLAEHKFINEERYGQRVYEYWLSKKYYGRQHLRLTLQKKMVQGDLIPDLVKKLSFEEEQNRAEAFTKLQLPKFQKKYGEEKQKIKAALARGLASRGFGTGVISTMVDRVP